MSLLQLRGRWLCVLLTVSALVSAVTAQSAGPGTAAAAAPVAGKAQVNPPAAAGPDQAKALSLSPAVIMTRGLPGQSLTQTLTISNQTGMTFGFEMIAQDIQVRNGHREFVNAGELPQSIAATAIFSRPTVTVGPGQSASVDVTVTLPPDTPVRAIVAIFHGTDRLQGQGAVAMTASLGCLITFTASNNFAISPSPAEIKPQTTTRPLTVSVPLVNTGTEPVIPEGVVALLSDSGKLVGKVPFNAQRLLPGERLEFTATYDPLLPPGHYQAISSFQFEDKTLSQTAEFTVE